MSIKKILANRSNGPSLLTGSDVPEGTKSFYVEIASTREPPEGFGALLIFDLKRPVYGKSAWALNKTNLKACAMLFGDDEKEWVGKRVKLELISARNPTTGQVVPSLAVGSKK
jgi:hypothetical protein